MASQLAERIDRLSLVSEDTGMYRRGYVSHYNHPLLRRLCIGPRRLIFKHNHKTLTFPNECPITKHYHHKAMLRAKRARSHETPDATDPQAVASRNDATAFPGKQIHRHSGGYDQVL